MNKNLITCGGKMKYRKKPIIVEVWQLQMPMTSWLMASMPRWLYDNRHLLYFDIDNKGDFMKIRTLEGDMFARSGDYIIKGIRDEIYPCRQDIFKETYEQVEEER